MDKKNIPPKPLSNEEIWKRMVKSETWRVNDTEAEKARIKEVDDMLKSLKKIR